MPVMRASVVLLKDARLQYSPVIDESDRFSHVGACHPDIRGKMIVRFVKYDDPQSKFMTVKLADDREVGMQLVNDYVALGSLGAQLHHQVQH